MSTFTPFQGSSNSDSLQHDERIWELAEECLQQTASALIESRCATPDEVSQALDRTRESHAQLKPCELIDVLVRIQGYDEENLSPAILAIGNKLASTLAPFTQLIPFAGKLIAPSAFYESFANIHKTARALLSPVIYVEDTDAMGVASANPIAATILAEEIRTTVFKRFGILPFLTITRLDYESWTFLTRKHFEL
jgi:hypothetical protein